MVMVKETEDKIERIMDKNLSEKNEKIIKKTKCCEDCIFYKDSWVWGRELHCCCQNSDNPQTSRDIEKLYDACPINHEMEVTKYYIKKYGIIHRKPDEDSYCHSSGSIAVVDFSDTTFEADGHNPDVSYENVVIFFYNTQEECDIMMELALDYYERFNLDAPYIEKHFLDY